ncbi:thioredoxin family protein [Enterococcus sp. BWM-S5]|uniref:Thioredoxin family protein n=1 Tax=Enterococcus larvae TaxID=2794352 RepID=A0ABS4CKV8_9ENTE|nr:thioredoxin family protein [Enterococcus larvae]MBP1047236.1 thioredoxin family protein [Enterococcus larvae]
MNKKSGKTIVIIIGIVALLGAGYLFYSDESTGKQKIPEIFTEQISELGNSGKEFVYIYSEECSACDFYFPIVVKAIDKTRASMYQVDYLKNENTDFFETNNIYNVPVILEIKDGKIINRYEGAKELQETVNIIE